MIHRSIVKCVGVVVLAVSSATLPASATVEGITTTVTRTLSVSDYRWGGCAVRLADHPSEAGLNCSSDWVTFSCTGDHATKSAAARNYDAALMAFALGRSVRVWVDDEKTHNGLCFVNRIDVLSP